MATLEDLLRKAGFYETVTETVPAEQRITLNMSFPDIFMAMSGGCAGAVTVCIELFKREGEIDSQAFAISSILHMDSLGIYEDRIWNFYKMCNRNVVMMIAVLLACRRGGLAGVTKQSLNHAIDNKGQGIDLEAVVKAVKDHLPHVNLDMVDLQRE